MEVDEAIIRRIVTESISMAKIDRESLVPVIGAGVSLPLGLPSWQKLIQQLTARASMNTASFTSREPLDLLKEIKQVLGDTDFVTSIQLALRLQSSYTSTALQALVTAPIRRLISTNLDFAIEVAFSKAGKSLRAENVGRGYSVEELALFDQSSNEPFLLKIHGSLERPSTWVLTQDDYDKAYIQPGHLKDFFSSRAWIPLFIGFSFNDFDLKESLRLAKLSRNSKAYILIQMKDVDTLAPRFKNTGVIPIGFYSFDQIPEIIDEIFQCSPLTIELCSYQNTTHPKLRIGGAEITLRQEIWDSLEKRQAVVDLLSNAFEIQPNFINDRSRRLHGQKGAYRDKLIDLLKLRDNELLRLVLQAMIQYPEILFESLVPSLLKREDVDHYPFIKTFFDAFAIDSPDCTHMEQLLLSNIHNPDLGYNCRIAIARLLAARELHPAMQIPPPHVKIGALLVPIYPLTRYQVGKVTGRPELQSIYPLRPYTLQSKGEIEIIIRYLRRYTGKNWRMPTEKEWIEIAGLKENPWPWGKTSPEIRIHAHLRYVYQGGNVAKHALEVGIFPKGRSVTGLFDVIGNVYEVVFNSKKEYALAGGAWTTSFNPERAALFPKVSHWSKGQNNVGIRPVLDIEGS